MLAFWQLHINSLTSNQEEPYKVNRQKEFHVFQFVFFQWQGVFYLVLFLLKMLTSHSKEAVIAKGIKVVEILEEFRTWAPENFERTPVVFSGAKSDP